MGIGIDIQLAEKQRKWQKIGKKQNGEFANISILFHHFI